MAMKYNGNRGYVEPMEKSILPQFTIVTYSIAQYVLHTQVLTVQLRVLNNFRVGLNYLFNLTRGLLFKYTVSASVFLLFVQLL